MDLTEDQLTQLEPKLNEYFRRLGECEVCGSQKWSVPPKIFEIREFFGGNLVAGGSVLPVLSITCNSCGNTYFLNAIILGLVESEEGEEEAAAEEATGSVASGESDAG